MIEDDEELGQRLIQYLKKFDINATQALTPSEGFSRLEMLQPDLLLLDIMLPEMNGFEVCKKIRERSDIPIIMLTARGELSDKVLGFEFGADDYLDKPFEPRELVARINGLLRRHNNTLDSKQLVEQWEFENLTINPKQHEVRLADEILELTGMEFKVLCLLAKTPGEVFSRDQLLNDLKGVDSEIYSRSIDILISRLRHKLGDSPKHTHFIKTVRNVGYVFIAGRK